MRSTDAELPFAGCHGSLAFVIQVRGYPTIKYFGAGRKDWDSAQDYDGSFVESIHTHNVSAATMVMMMTMILPLGGRTTESIVSWATDKWSTNQPPPEVHQLTSWSTMVQCTERQLCFVAFFPHILDSSADTRNSYIQTMRDVGRLKRQIPCVLVS